MKIAINGAGIAGTTLACWLHRYGHEPVLVEQAPQLRTGGYVIDFWGVGYESATLWLRWQDEHFESGRTMWRV